MNLAQFVFLPEQHPSLQRASFPRIYTSTGVADSQSIMELPPVTNNIHYMKSQKMKGRTLVSFLPSAASLIILEI